MKRKNQALAVSLAGVMALSGLAACSSQNQSEQTD